MAKRYVLTFDIDWAPDYAILNCLKLLENSGCKATFFATHNTSLNQEIINRGHNLGIHPNFLQGSSHGLCTCFWERQKMFFQNELHLRIISNWVHQNKKG